MFLHGTFSRSGHSSTYTLHLNLKVLGDMGYPSFPCGARRRPPKTRARSPQIRSAADAARQGPSATPSCGTPHPHDVMEKTPNRGDCDGIGLEAPRPRPLRVDTRDTARASSLVCACVGRREPQPANYALQVVVYPRGTCIGADVGPVRRFDGALYGDTACSPFWQEFPLHANV